MGDATKCMTNHGHSCTMKATKGPGQRYLGSTSHSQGAQMNELQAST